MHHLKCNNFYVTNFKYYPIKLISFLSCIFISQYCKRVWLGLWNSHLPPEPDSRDEQKVKDFLIKKYEKKTYYVPPDQVKPVTREKEKEKVPEIRPLKSLLGENSPKVQVSQVSRNLRKGDGLIPNRVEGRGRVVLAPNILEIHVQ